MLEEKTNATPDEEQDCSVNYMRDTDACEKCPLGRKMEECPKYKKIKERWNNAWAEAVWEYGD